MSFTQTNLQAEIARRRTFAIISHPDAGKTTLTEKLLLYGGAIHLAGAVKPRRSNRHTASDWMALERERGISISTSVLQFQYRGRHLNLLDTPGHNDFSEDTYRTLAAVDCAIMLIDSVKGVEPQTIKLFQACRLRGLPIVTFLNKMDREGRDPLDLLDEIEKVLGLPGSPANWPIGAGSSFQGVYDRWGRQLFHFHKDLSAPKVALEVAELEDPRLRQQIGAEAHRKLLEELDLLEGAGHQFDRDRFLTGELTPVFFGSAINDFGVAPFLDRFIELAPAPTAVRRPAAARPPDSPEFSAFVFKIQANMDPQHRDRTAFLRIWSGRFFRGMEARHVRTGKVLSLTRPVQFLAQERKLIEEAFAGDIIGLWDPGLLRIGDSLCTGEPVEFEEIPRFSPEHFAQVRLTDPGRRKQLKKGLDQLSEEGAVQVFFDRHRLERDPILGAVGLLQFDVVQYRLRAEYGVEADLEPLPYKFARWIEAESFDPDAFEQSAPAICVIDVERRPLVLFKNEWSLRDTTERHPELRFIAAVQPGRSARFA
jgi:peptide chain release factor 3